MDNTPQAPQTPQASTAAARPLLSIPLSIIIAGVLVAGAIIYTNSYSTGGNTQEGQQTAIEIREVSADDHVYGSRDAGTFLVEYSDFECPYCARIHPDLKRIVDESDGKIAWVYRHFPLDSIHPEAVPSAVTSECIAQLGGNDAFWTFADHVIAHQSRIGNALYVEAAGKAGITSKELSACLGATSFTEKINADMEEAISAGGTGTPFVVIVSGEKKLAFAGALPYATIKQAIASLGE